MCVGVRFTSTDGSMYFGRNYDWNTSYGETVVAVPAGYAATWRFQEPSACKHDVIGTGIVMRGFPMFYDAANDAGLAIANLAFAESARYPEGPVEGKLNVATYELPLWVTGCFETVAQVKDALSDGVIVGGPAGSGVTGLHWIVADATESIVIESTERGLEIFDDDVDVITNEPDFAWHRKNLRNYAVLKSEHNTGSQWGEAEVKPIGHGPELAGLPGDYSPVSRFVKAAYVNTHYPAQESEADNVARMFTTLNSVAVPLGTSAMEDGTWDCTLFQDMFSAKTNTYYFSRLNETEIHAYRLDDVDFGGKTEPVKL